MERDDGNRAATTWPYVGRGRIFTDGDALIAEGVSYVVTEYIEVIHQVHVRGRNETPGLKDVDCELLDPPAAVRFEEPIVLELDNGYRWACYMSDSYGRLTGGQAALAADWRVSRARRTVPGHSACRVVEKSYIPNAAPRGATRRRLQNLPPLNGRGATVSGNRPLGLSQRLIDALRRTASCAIG